MSLSDVEKLSEKHAKAANALAAKVAEVDVEMCEVADAARTEINRLVKQCAKTQAALRKAVASNRGQFEKPRTQVFAGIKVGFAKGKDTVTFDNEKTCTLIKRHFPELVPTLIQTTHKPVASALLNLEPAQLKKIAAQKVPGTDQLVLKPVGSAVAKVVSAHLQAASAH